MKLRIIAIIRYRIEVNVFVDQITGNEYWETMYNNLNRSDAIKVRNRHKCNDLFIPHRIRKYKIAY